MPAWVNIKRRKKNKRGQLYWEVVHAKGHLDEVQALGKAVGVCLSLLTGGSCLRKATWTRCKPSGRLWVCPSPCALAAHACKRTPGRGARPREGCGCVPLPAHWRLMPANGRLDEVHALGKAVGVSLCLRTGCQSCSQHRHQTEGCQQTAPMRYMPRRLTASKHLLCRFVACHTGSQLGLLCRFAAVQPARFDRGEGARRRSLLPGFQGRRGVKSAAVRAQTHAQGHRAAMPGACVLRTSYHAQHRAPVLHTTGVCSFHTCS